MSRSICARSSSRRRCRISSCSADAATAAPPGRITDAAHPAPFGQAPPAPQHRRLQAQLGHHLRQRPTAVPQQDHRLALELVRKLPSRLPHRHQHLRSRRSLHEVSTVTGDGQRLVGLPDGTHGVPHGRLASRQGSRGQNQRVTGAPGPAVGGAPRTGCAVWPRSTRSNHLVASCFNGLPSRPVPAPAQALCRTSRGAAGVATLEPSRSGHFLGTGRTLDIRLCTPGLPSAAARAVQRVDPLARRRWFPITGPAGKLGFQERGLQERRLRCWPPCPERQPQRREVAGYRKSRRVCESRATPAGATLAHIGATGNRPSTIGDRLEG